MKFKSMEKICEGKFITRYNLLYETEDNQEKTYEMISRNPGIRSFDDLHDKKPDAVVLIMENESGDKILLNREFRMAVGEWVYNFPAGLIEPGEPFQTAADRELFEETGLHIARIDEILGESYSAVGFANEKNVCVLGVASGSFQKSNSVLEEIEAGWFSREDVRRLLKTEKFAARTQAYLYLWSRQ